MLKSMTAYSKAYLNHPLGRFTLEIQSVNRKFLELNINLPNEFLSLETMMRKELQKELFCGQVNVTLRAFFEKKSLFSVTPNLPLARELYQALQKISQELNLEQHFDLNLLANHPDMLIYLENQEYKEEFTHIIQELIQDALSKFIEMRQNEGKALVQDFQKRLQQIESHMGTIEKTAPSLPEKFRNKLLQRIKELLPDSIENEERVLREMIIYAEKVDVQEEITRIHSHISQFKTLLQGKKEGIGKNLDFLSQELARELNTLGAKTCDLESSKLVVEMKTELARIREQIQNVE